MRTIRAGALRRVVIGVAVMAAAGIGLVWAQEQAPATAEAQRPAIEWQHGPSTGKLGSIAEIAVPEGYAFADSKGAVAFLKATENFPSGDELGILIKTDDDGLAWFAIFEFDEVGYIKDDEKDSLDADGILNSVREGTERANKERRKRGWTPLDIVGWEQAPFYEPDTHNLSWAIRARSGEDDVVNFNTRLLGRRGVVSANLVIDPERLAAETPVFKQTLAGFAFTSGNRYAEFRSGDKVATYGLTALVAGGAAAVALKTGLLQKFWKLILVGLIGIGTGLKKLFGSRKAGTDAITRVEEPPPPQVP